MEQKRISLLRIITNRLASCSVSVETYLNNNVPIHVSTRPIGNIVSGSCLHWDVRFERGKEEKSIDVGRNRIELSIPLVFVFK